MLRLIVRRVILLLSLALLFLGAAILPAGAEEARNLASACTFSASRGSTRRFDALYDHDYGRYWQAGRAKNNYLEILLMIQYYIYYYLYLIIVFFLQLNKFLLFYHFLQKL